MSAKEDGLMMAGIIGMAILSFFGLLTVMVGLSVAVEQLPHTAYVAANITLLVIVIAAFGVGLYRCLHGLAFMLHTPFSMILIGLALQEFAPGVSWATELMAWAAWWLGVDMILAIIAVLLMLILSQRRRTPVREPQSQPRRERSRYAALEQVQNTPEYRAEWERILTYAPYMDRKQLTDTLQHYGPVITDDDIAYIRAKIREGVEVK